MDLLEYQAKQLFTTIGIPVLSSQSISQPSELKNLHIPYPVVLKSQVKAGGRGKVGGIKFVENTIDAIAAAQNIFSLAIEGEYPEVVLAEARYDVENEFFLAIMFDNQLTKPVLLGSSHGGIDVETVLEKMQICVIDDDFSPFYARRLAVKMGLEGNLIDSVSPIIQKMYALFWEYDLDIIEINPLGINSDGEVMALDGKIRVNDYGLARHPDLLELIGYNAPQNLDLDLENPQNLTAKLACPSFFSLNSQGNIAVIYDNLDSALVTNNLILEKKGKIGACFILDKKLQLPITKQLNTIFEEIFNNNKLEIIFINILTSDELNQEIVEAIANFYQSELNNQLNKGQERRERLTGSISRPRQTSTKTKASQVKKIQPSKQIQWVLRIVGENLAEHLTDLADFPIKHTNSLEEAISLLA